LWLEGSGVLNEPARDDDLLDANTLAKWLGVTIQWLNFTINLDLNAGPNWTLAKFKGPNASSQGGTNGSGLANVSRLAKDSLILTVIPICIRPKYFPTQWKNLRVSDLQAKSSNSPPGRFRV
jgi:hypothetical protein